MVFQTQVPISLVIGIQDLYTSKYKYTIKLAYGYEYHSYYNIPCSNSCAAANPHLGLCHYALMAVVLWPCSNAKQGEIIVYANYWLEHKLTDQLKIQNVDFSLTFI